MSAAPHSNRSLGITSFSTQHLPRLPTPAPRKQFFFEKKNQKTFALEDALRA
jgi:hypothetical protein